MPRISFFYGITIAMYWNEGVHAKPHFHARYAGEAASIDFDGAVVAGSLPPRAVTLVGEWARLPLAELEANWDRARRDEPLERSIPCRNLGTMERLVDIVDVRVVGDHRLRLTFADGLAGDVDFSGRNWRGVFELLADSEYFARVRVDPELGTIAWPNGVDMAPEPLYERCAMQSATG